MAAGRHMMVWVWYYNDAPQWSTCFDVMISGSASNPIASASSAAYTAPAAVSTKAAVVAPAATSAKANVAVEPVNNDAPVVSPIPTPTPAVPVYGGATTVTEWFTEWTTDYVVETAAPGYKGRRHAHKRHARQF